MQTLETDRDSHDTTTHTTIYTDGEATHAAQPAVTASMLPLAPHVTMESTVSAVYRQANGALPFKRKSKLGAWKAGHGSKNFTTGGTRLNRRCSCLTNNVNNK